MTCCRCGEPATRGFGIHDICDACLEPIRERVIARANGIGLGVQVGPLREDWGNGFADLRCDVEACSAGWVGVPGEVCGWCVRWIELANETQRRVLLWPDLPEDDDERRKRAMVAWVERLAAAVRAEIVTEHEARAAARREAGRRVA